MKIKPSLIKSPNIEKLPQKIVPSTGASGTANQPVKLPGLQVLKINKKIWWRFTYFTDDRTKYTLL